MYANNNDSLALTIHDLVNEDWGLAVDIAADLMIAAQRRAPYDATTIQLLLEARIEYRDHAWSSAELAFIESKSAE